MPQPQEPSYSESVIEDTRNVLDHYFEELSISKFEPFTDIHGILKEI